MTAADLPNRSSTLRHSRWHFQVGRAQRDCHAWGGPWEGTAARSRQFFSARTEPIVRDNFDPYVVLGVSPIATQAEIAHAYRDRLRAHHPDTRHTGSSRGADELLQQVLGAYALLRDPTRRADYDEAAARLAAASHYRARTPTGDSTPGGSVEIPVTYRTSSTSTARVTTSPLRAGPVRRHR